MYLGAEFAQRQGKLLEYSDVVFKSYWSDSKDISQDDVMEEIVKSVGKLFLNPYRLTCCIFRSKT